MDDFREFFSVFVVISCIIVIPLAAVTAVDYYISAGPTVNAINAHCDTSYQKVDYLRIGKEAMLQMCETRQKRIELR